MAVCLPRYLRCHLRRRRRRHHRYYHCAMSLMCRKKMVREVKL